MMSAPPFLRPVAFLLVLSTALVACEECPECQACPECEAPTIGVATGATWEWSGVKVDYPVLVLPGTARYAFGPQGQVPYGATWTPDGEAGAMRIASAAGCTIVGTDGKDYEVEAGVEYEMSWLPSEGSAWTLYLTKAGATMPTHEIPVEARTEPLSLPVLTMYPEVSDQSMPGASLPAVVLRWGVRAGVVPIRI